MRMIVQRVHAVDAVGCEKGLYFTVYCLFKQLEMTVYWLVALYRCCSERIVGVDKSGPIMGGKLLTFL